MNDPGKQLVVTDWSKLLVHDSIRGLGNLVEKASGADDATSLLEMYLVRHGWSSSYPGIAGSLWRHDDAVVAVPRTIEFGTHEYLGVVERVAAIERRPVEAVQSRIRLQLTDVARLSAAHDGVITGSIPLEAGVSLVTSAWSMVRAAATTSVRPRGHIGGNFSRVGDEIVESARLGHTQEGSYVFPILVPLNDFSSESSNRPSMQEYSSGQQGFDGMSVTREAKERRVTRTLAQALAAISEAIVQPAREPKASDVAPIVMAGASRELVMAVHRVVSDPSVARFAASFDWAEAVGSPGGVPQRINIPSDSAPLLSKAAGLLRSSTYTPDENVSGPIVEIRHTPDDPFGFISIQTVRRGRPAEVRVMLPVVRLVHAYDWARDGRPVIAEGRIQRKPGHPLLMQNARSLRPVDETYLAIE